MPLEEQELERLYEHVSSGQDEQSVLTRRLLADVLLERAACAAIGVNVVGAMESAIEYRPVIFLPAEPPILGQELSR